MKASPADKSGYKCPWCSGAFEGFGDLRAHVVSQHANEPLPRPDGLIKLTNRNLTSPGCVVKTADD